MTYLMDTLLNKNMLLQSLKGIPQLILKTEFRLPTSPPTLLSDLAWEHL